MQRTIELSSQTFVRYKASLRLITSQQFNLLSARQLGLYWEGDLRKQSYFLNKRKELEFFI